MLKRLYKNVPVSLYFSTYTQQLEVCSNHQLKEIVSTILKKPPSDKFTYIALLKQCTSLNALQEGKTVHELILQNNVKRDIFLDNSLLNMYCKCNRIEEAQVVFEKMDTRTVFSWTSMIGLYARNGHRKEAFHLFHNMQLEGVKPNEVTYVTIFNVCEELELVDELVLRSECIQVDIIFGTALMNAYGRCGNLDTALEIFDAISSVADTTVWNVMIGLLAAHEMYGVCIELFHTMLHEGVCMNKGTSVNVLKGCNQLQDGILIHRCSKETGDSTDVVVSTALLNMYGKFGRVKEAEEVFRETEETRDVISWNAMITVYARNSLHGDALRCSRSMMLSGEKLYVVTYVAVLSACFSPRHLSEGEWIRGLAEVYGYMSDVSVSSAVMNMYIRCGHSESVGVVKDIQPGNVTVWNPVLSAYVEKGEFDAAFKTFRLMLQWGVFLDSAAFVTMFNVCANKPCLVTGKLLYSLLVENGSRLGTSVENAILNMYTKCGSMGDAEKMFSAMNYRRNIVSWTTMISAYTQQGSNKESVRLFMQMLLEGLQPNDVSFTAVSNACGGLASLSSAKMIKSCLYETEFFRDIDAANILLCTLGKCGSLAEVFQMFDNMTIRDTVSWNTVIAANAQHGDGETGLGMFWRMQLEGAEVDNVTVICLLSACSHAGLVAEGYSHFLYMNEDHGLSANEEHYNCVVDLLSRAGWLEYAEELTKHIPWRNSAPWGTLLCGCKIHGDLERARRITKHIMSSSPGACLVMYNLYAGAGKWTEAAYVRKNMIDMGPKKEAGLSWIEVNGRIHEFKVGDMNHPRTNEIYKELHRIDKLVKAAGYTADTKLVAYDVEEGEKDSLLCCHSERLAIAYGMIATPGGTLRIMKNLRVCGDCHTVTKFISKVMEREIVVRDAHRFHLFKNGTCSCRDYW